MSVGSFMLTMSISCFMWFLPHRRSVSTTDRLHRPGVLCVFLCHGRKLKAPQRHIDNTVIDSYFHSDISFWRFICFVAVFCSLADTLTTQRTKQRQKRFICFVWFVLALCPALKEGGTPPAPGGVVVVMRCRKAH